MCLGWHEITSTPQPFPSHHPQPCAGVCSAPPPQQPEATLQGSCCRHRQHSGMAPAWDSLSWDSCKFWLAPCFPTNSGSRQAFIMRENEPHTGTRKYIFCSILRHSMCCSLNNSLRLGNKWMLHTQSFPTGRCFQAMRRWHWAALSHGVRTISWGRSLTVAAGTVLQRSCSLGHHGLSCPSHHGAQTLKPLAGRDPPSLLLWGAGSRTSQQPPLHEHPPASKGSRHSAAHRWRGHAWRDREPAGSAASRQPRLSGASSVGAHPSPGLSPATAWSPQRKGPLAGSAPRGSSRSAGRRAALRRPRHPCWRRWGPPAHQRCCSARGRCRGSPRPPAWAWCPWAVWARSPWVWRAGSRGRTAARSRAWCRGTPGPGCGWTPARSPAAWHTALRLAQGSHPARGEGDGTHGAPQQPCQPGSHLALCWERPLESSPHQPKGALMLQTPDRPTGTAFTSLPLTQPAFRGAKCHSPIPIAL